MTEKQLLFGILFLFILSTGYLFFVNARGLDPETGKSWWSVSFTQPEAAESLVFTVVNHSDDPVFRYTIKQGTETLTTDELHIGRGESETVDPKRAATREQETTVSVEHTDSTQSIFR